MAKQGKKRTRGRQKSKAAIATAERRAEKAGSDAGAGLQQSVEYKGSGGVMSNLRGGFQAAVGTGEPAQKQSNWMGNILWVLLALGTLALLFGDIRL